MKKTKQLILNSLQNEESCLKDLIVKIEDQQKAIEEQDEGRVLEIIEEKNALMKIFKNLEKNVETQLQLLSQQEIEGLAKEGETLKLDIDSKSHSAWIGGTQKILDKGRVSKFFKRFKNLRSTKKNDQ